MATESLNIPSTLLAKLKEAANREKISVEELVQDALEKRINVGMASLFDIGDRNVKRTGALPEDVEAELAAARLERSR